MSCWRQKIAVTSAGESSRADRDATPRRLPPGGTQHRIRNRAQGRGPAATPQLAHSGTGKYAARKDADGDAFASCGAGSNKNIPRGQKLGALKIPGPGDQSDREGLRARNNHQAAGKRAFRYIYGPGCAKESHKKLEEKRLCFAFGTW